MQLLPVQTDDRNSNYFYQNLLTTMRNRPTFLSSSLFRTKDKLLVFYSESQATTLITSMHTPHYSSRRSIYDTTKSYRLSKDMIDAIYREHSKRNSEQCRYLKGNVS